MTGALRRHALPLVVALVTASLTAGAPALAAKAVKLAKKAKFAKNAGKLDGLDSTAFVHTSNFTWTNLSEIPAGFADGTDNVGGTAEGLNCVACVSVAELDFDPATQAELDALPAPWLLAGNAGTAPASQFLGTTDNTPLNVRVNDERVARFEPDATSPSVIFGFSGNSVSTSGATIGGGGQLGSPNAVLDDFGTVGGGAGNEAGHPVGNADFATVGGGGTSHTADDAWTTIGGGSTNVASAARATVGGGNTNTADGNSSTVGGGAFNVAAANYTTIAGGAPSNFGNTGLTRNEATDEYGTIGGGGDNLTGNGGVDTTDSPYGTVAGGQSNIASGDHSTVGGGIQNNSSGDQATIGGGATNTASGPQATVAGGQSNEATSTRATIGGGFGNAAVATQATIGGGVNNDASGAQATVSGGQENAAAHLYATVGGGQSNDATNQWATIGGGEENTANGLYATVPGGSHAVASLHGQMAHASGQFSAAGDGQTSEFVLRNTTANATPTELFLDGVDDRLTLGAGRRLSFEALVVGGTSAGETGGYRVTGLIENIGGATALVGAPAVTELGEDDPTWDVAFSADDTNDALEIEVTGDIDDPTRWLAMVQTAEVVF